MKLQREGNVLVETVERKAPSLLDRIAADTVLDEQPKKETRKDLLTRLGKRAEVFTAKHSVCVCGQYGTCRKVRLNVRST